MKRIIPIIFLFCFLCSCGVKAEEAPIVPEPLETPISTPAVLPTPSPDPMPSPEPTSSPEPTPAQLSMEPGAHLLRFDDPETGDYLDYWLVVPDNAVEGMPLLIFLHGDGNRAMPESLENNPLRQSLEEIYGDETPFLLLMPNTRVWSWTAGTIPETLIHLIENTAEEYKVDPEHLMISGHSRGAIGTWYYISRYPELFSAAVPISCGCDEALDYEAMAAVPVWGFAGNIGQDGTHYLPAMQNIAAGINEAGGSARIDVLAGCDHAAAEKAAWNEEVFKWLLSQ